MNRELPDVQTGFRKGRGTRDQIANICWIIKIAREFQTTWPASWQICMQVKKPQLELDIKQQTGSRSGKESMKAVYCHPAYLIYMQSISWKWQPTPVFLPGEFHGQRSLAGYRPWGCKESGMTEHLSLTHSHPAKCQPGWSTRWNQHRREKYQ